jgi:hypothetical protein
MGHFGMAESLRVTGGNLHRAMIQTKIVGKRRSSQETSPFQNIMGN